MRCDDLNRWLDEGMPPQAAAEASAHARECGACARAMAAAVALERAFAAAPPVPPGGADRFVARVLEQISPLPAPIAQPARSRLWWGLLSEPAFVVGAVILLAVLLLPSALRHDAGQSLAISATVASQAVGSAIENAARPLLEAMPVLQDLGPSARVSLITTIAALLVWAGFWMVGAVDRWLRQSLKRPV